MPFVIVVAMVVVVPVVVFGIVAVVALVRANPDDVPTVVEACNGVFRRLVDRLATPPRVPPSGATPCDHRVEEAP